MSVLFSALILTQKFAIKKNSKMILRNRATGRPFISSNPRAKSLEEMLVLRLRSLAMQKRLDPITDYVNCKITFYFPRSVYFTKKGEISKLLPDLSNLFESVTDSLQKAQILENDRLISGFDGSRRMISKDNNYYLQIEITKLEQII
jgi:Holliday junction resolvase RusA-like endonuclease